MPHPRTHRVRAALALTATAAIMTGCLASSPPSSSYANEPSQVVSQVAGQEQFYVFESRPGWRLANGTSQSPGAYIREVVYDTATDTFLKQGEVVGEYIDLPLRLEVTSSLRTNVNSLGVSPDGTFYFTTQLGSEAQQGTVDIWQYRPLDTSAGPAAPVTENFMLNSMGGGVIVGGAVNPRDNAYYFLYFSRFDSQAQAANAKTTNPDRWEETIRAHLYRYDATRTPQAGEVGHVDFYHHSEFSRTSSMNGDIAFDRQGNLHLVVSTAAKPAKPEIDQPAQPGAAQLVTLSYQDFGTLPNVDPQIGTAPVPTLSPTSTTGGSGQPVLRPVHEEGVYNGIAFAESGALIVGQGNRQTFSDPQSFQKIGSPQTLTPQTNFSNVDLASAAAPPTITVEQVLIGERLNPTDQFELTASQSTPGTTERHFTAALTTGTASGTQTEHIGPAPMLPQGVFTASSVATAPDSYTTRHECSTLDAQGNPDAPFYAGSGSTLAFPYLDTVPGAASGSQAVRCVFISEPRIAALSASKTATPASGTQLTAGDTVQYRLTFDNTTGTADAENVAYTEHLADVLDDASYSPDSLRYGDGAETGYDTASPTPNGLTVTTQTGGDLAITGTVPAGETRTVWLSVTVTADQSTATLNNYLLPTGGVAPGNCTVASGMFTTHPVEASTPPANPNTPGTTGQPERSPADDSSAPSDADPRLPRTGGVAMTLAALMGAALLSLGSALVARSARRERAQH